MMQNFTFNGPYGEIECIVNACSREDAPVLIMAHGFRGSRDGGGKAVEVAAKVSEAAVVIRFNFNGSQILSRQVQELQAVIKKTEELLPKRKIILLGRSLGGAASIITAGSMPNISGLILWATPNNLRETFRDVLGNDSYRQLDAGKILHLEDERGKIDLTPDFLTDIDNYNLEKILADFKSLPVLLFHGKADETVKVQQAYKNNAILNTVKELHVFENGDHSLAEYSNEAAEIITDWLKKFV